MLNLSISICLHFHRCCNVQKQVDHIRTFWEGMIHDALQRCVCCNFGFLVYVANLFLLLVQVLRLPVWIFALLGLTVSLDMLYFKPLQMKAKIGADGKNTMLRIVIGDTSAVERGCFLKLARVQLIAKCSDDAADEPTQPSISSTIDGQDVPSLHFSVHRWSSYVNNLASITRSCVDTWANENGVFFHCADGETDTPAAVAAILSEATGKSPFHYLNVMPKKEIKTQRCVRQKDVLMHLERVRLGQHRSSPQSSQGDAMAAVGVAVSPGVRTDILAAGVNQCRIAVSDSVPVQSVNEFDVAEQEGDGFTHPADSPAAAREEPAPCRHGLLAKPCRFTDVRKLNNDKGDGFTHTVDSPAAAREEPAPSRHGLLAKPCRFTDVRKLNNETKTSSPAAVTPAAAFSSSGTNRWTGGSTSVAAEPISWAWQVHSGTRGGAWRTAGGGGGRGRGFQCYTCGGLGHKSDVCPTPWS